MADLVCIYLSLQTKLEAILSDTRLSSICIVFLTKHHKAYGLILYLFKEVPIQTAIFYAQLMHFVAKMFIKKMQEGQSFHHYAL